MISCYIAGPFRAKTPWGIAQNVRKAETVHLAACRLGLVSLCPHKNTEHFQGECSDEFWINMTMHMLRFVINDRGVLIALPECWESSGTRGEIKAASAAGMPVFHAPTISDDPLILRTAERRNGETLGEWLAARAGQR